MNFAHIHVVVNHIPSIGTVVGLALFATAILKKSDELKKIALQILVVMALAALPTYLSGNAAQLQIRRRPDIPLALIEAHQNSAMLTLILMTITGTTAWFGLWQFRRFSSAGSGNTAAVLISAAVTAAFILRTANMGGEISHPEIRSGQEFGLAEEIGWRAPFELFSNQQSWVWPASETLHFLGMAALFGVTLLVCLRMLGMMKSIPFSAVHRMLPLAILGFVINVVSGMVFFIASPGMYVSNQGFIAKIVFLLIAGICALYFTMFEQPWRAGPDKDAPLIARIVAVGYMASLLGVMYFGRMLPFMQQ